MSEPAVISSTKTALFPGSFNPFTRGHLRIAERALEIAARLIIAIGYNPSKASSEDFDFELKKRIERIRAGIPYSFADRIEIRTYNTLTADFARKVGADFIVRGVRDSADFEYERKMADINLKVLGIDTVILVAEPDFSFISGSALRELEYFGHDISSFLP